MGILGSEEDAADEQRISWSKASLRECSHCARRPRWQVVGGWYKEHITPLTEAQQLQEETRVDTLITLDSQATG